MATRLDFELNLDDSNLSPRINAMRSNLSMMFGTASGDFGGAMSGLAQFGGAATSAYGMMRQGLTQAGQITTATDPSMAYSMHHGMIQAQSTFGQELQSVGMHPLAGGGPVAFAGMTPPGVGAADYTRMLQANFGRRMTEVGAGVVSGVAGGVAGMAGWSLGGFAGKALFGGLGGLAGGFIGAMAVERLISAGVERGNKIFDEVQSLGNIATAGRGMGLAQTHEFGRGFRSIASRMGISTGEARDIFAGIRQAGMMPETRDVQQSLQQFESMARSIRDISVGMQTSLSTATRYLRDVERMGLGQGAGGVFAAAGMADRLGTTLGGLIGFVGQGQRVGMATGIGGGAGGQLALGSAFAGAAGLGALTGSERLMVGGALGLGRAFQMQALQNALGPWGQVQGMAMMGPTGAQGLPGTAMGTISQAAGNIFGGGDPIANMIEFQTGRTRMLGQLGGRGIRMMQAQAIQTQANMLRDISPGLTQQRALQFVGMQQGLSEHQARAMAGYIQRGFRDPSGPSGAALGIPSVFGSSRVAGMESRAMMEGRVREEYAEARRANRFFWERGIDWMGEVWSGVRQNMAESADAWAKHRLVQQGFVAPGESAMAEARAGIRGGGGILGTSLVSIAGMGAQGAAAQAMLQFAGATPGAGGTGISLGGDLVVSAEEAGAGLSALGREIAHSSRLTSSEEAFVNQQSELIGRRVQSGNFRSQRAAERVRWNAHKILHGSKDPNTVIENLKSDFGEILKGTAFEKGYKKQGFGLFGSEKGAEAMVLINRYMRAQGVGGFDTGRTISRITSLGMTAIGRGVEDVAVSIMRGNTINIEERAKEIVSASQAAAEEGPSWGERILAGVLGASENIGTGVISLEEARGIAQNEARAVSARIGDEVVKLGPAFGAVRGLKEYREYVKAKDRLYYHPWRTARREAKKKYGHLPIKEQKIEIQKYVKERAPRLKEEAIKKGKAELENKRKTFMAAAGKLLTPGAKIAAKIQLSAMDKDKVRADAALAQLRLEGKGERRRGQKEEGRVVAFQSQQESFQSQVAIALRKTTLVLDKLSKSIPPPRGRGAKTGAGAGD